MVLCCASRCSVFKFFLSLYMLCFFIFICDAANFLDGSCSYNKTFSPNDGYLTNVVNLLYDFSSNERNTMFYNATVKFGVTSDRVYGLYMCRADVTMDTCRDCVKSAASVVGSVCRVQKAAYIWYDECMLRYDNKSLFSSIDMSNSYLGWDKHLSNYPEENSTYNTQVLRNSLNKLATRASDENYGNGGQIKGFATGETNLTDFIKLYLLVQCIPYLSGIDCNRCLTEAIIDTVNMSSMGNPLSGKGMLSSCIIRYDNYSFYQNVASLAPSPGPTHPPPRGNERFSTRAIIAIVVSIIFFLLLFICGFCFLRRRSKKHDSILGGIDGHEISKDESLQYNLSTIGAATNNFSCENKVGEGGFGDVFKGILFNGQEIAVKRLSTRSTQGAEEFKNEVGVIAKLQHKNLVRLVGFCLEREEKILIYEFVPNKSLDYFLFDQEKQHVLDWPRRYKIVSGIAQGILYLHEHSRLKIIHRDLKASNVLLDGDMTPKISDFGLARIFGVDQYQANTGKVVGTFGYMAPEYLIRGQFSIKSDIFSFGVIILEIVSGKRSSSFYQSGGSENLLSLAWKFWRDGTPLDFVDPTLRDSIIEDEVIKCINIGLLCVQEDADQRPTMAILVHMLTSDSSSINLPLPQQPAFLIRSRIEAVQNQLESNLNPMLFSANELSISEFYPR